MSDAAVKTARSERLVACRRCARIWPWEQMRCERCGARLVHRERGALFWVWFWWVLGLLAFVPAMLWPMLESRMLYKKSADTIVGGAISLAEHGSWGIALIILIASVLIPFAKFLTIATLALKVATGRGPSAEWSHRLYHLVELIGRWSMVDIFVVAILSSLVQFSVVATIKPGPAALAFALSVIFTMLSAQAFDSRRLWDVDPGGSKN